MSGIFGPEWVTVDLSRHFSIRPQRVKSLRNTIVPFPRGWAQRVDAVGELGQSLGITPQFPEFSGEAIATLPLLFRPLAFLSRLFLGRFLR